MSSPAADGSNPVNPSGSGASSPRRSGSAARRRHGIRSDRQVVLRWVGIGSHGSSVGRRLGTSWSADGDQLGSSCWTSSAPGNAVGQPCDPIVSVRCVFERRGRRSSRGLPRHRPGRADARQERADRPGRPAARPVAVVDHEAQAGRTAHVGTTAPLRPRAASARTSAGAPRWAARRRRSSRRRRESAPRRTSPWRAPPSEGMTCRPRPASGPSRGVRPVRRAWARRCWGPAAGGRERLRSRGRGGGAGALRGGSALRTPPWAAVATSARGRRRCGAGTARAASAGRPALGRCTGVIAAGQRRRRRRWRWSGGVGGLESAGAGAGAADGPLESLDAGQQARRATRRRPAA